MDTGEIFFGPTLGKKFFFDFELELIYTQGHSQASSSPLGLNSQCWLTPSLLAHLLVHSSTAGFVCLLKQSWELRLFKGRKPKIKWSRALILLPPKPNVIKRAESSPDPDVNMLQVSGDKVSVIHVQLDHTPLW